MDGLLCVVGVHVEGLTYSSRTGVRTYVCTRQQIIISTRGLACSYINAQPPTAHQGQIDRIRESQVRFGRVTYAFVISCDRLVSTVGNCHDKQVYIYQNANEFSRVQHVTMSGLEPAL